jgi:hypothetical protein
VSLWQSLFWFTGGEKILLKKRLKASMLTWLYFSNFTGTAFMEKSCEAHQILLQKQLFLVYPEI